MWKLFMFLKSEDEFVGVVIHDNMSANLETQQQTRKHDSKFRNQRAALETRQLMRKNNGKLRNMKQHIHKHNNKINQAYSKYVRFMANLVSWQQINSKFRKTYSEFLQNIWKKTPGSLENWQRIQNIHSRLMEFMENFEMWQKF